MSPLSSRFLRMCSRKAESGEYEKANSGDSVGDAAAARACRCDPVRADTEQEGRCKVITRKALTKIQEAADCDARGLAIAEAIRGGADILRMQEGRTLELVAACKRTLASMERRGMTGETVDSLREAIAKAEGGAHVPA